MEGKTTAQVSALLEDDLLRKLEGVNGISTVNTDGMVTDAVHVQLDPEKVEKLNREEKGKIQVQTGDARSALNSRIVQAEEGAAQIQESKKQMQTAQEAMAVQKEMTVSSLENLSLLFI